MTKNILVIWFNMIKYFDTLNSMRVIVVILYINKIRINTTQPNKIH
ncbi:hypothetical protein PBCV1_a682aL [Paramecium bursaria Chlorella virus 1]|uniref:Uncharacterized protein n=1 Tax=Paramecium bursaria Chlorella virus 1 TaxID=10506 RepID=F8TU84_PBCV1|nr:hypothetical protein PBCV1_a682aL [Paramecium bursaria Chlorella virus 1]AEI70145.1 hypothetical protein [Paramecium bursaria Chlorella virus 1]